MNSTTDSSTKAPLVVKFVVERQTKNTVRYMELAPEGEEVIRTLYIQKRDLRILAKNSGLEFPPQNLTVTIQAAD